jgi:hypothetical protein
MDVYIKTRDDESCRYRGVTMITQDDPNGDLERIEIYKEGSSELLAMFDASEILRLETEEYPEKKGEGSLTRRE